MATVKKKRRAKPKLTIPLAVVAGFAPGAMSLMDHSRNPQIFAREASRIFIGFDPETGKWDFGKMKFGTFPMLFGFMLHSVANRFGINRQLAAARIPFLRI